MEKEPPSKSVDDLVKGVHPKIHSADGSLDDQKSDQGEPAFSLSGSLVPPREHFGVGGPRSTTSEADVMCVTTGIVQARPK